MSLRVGVVGAGRWGKNIVGTLTRLAEFELRQVCDLTEVRLGVPWTADVEQLLADPELQAVFIATPAETHAELACRALQRGKHVFVEKPLCISSTQAARIVEQSERGSARLMVGHLLAYHPAVRGISRLFEHGRLSGLCSVRVERHSLPHDLQPDALPRCPWWTLAPHDLALLQSWFGPATRIRVTALNWGSVRAQLQYEGAEAELLLSTVASKKVRRISLATATSEVLFDDLGPHKLVLREAGRPRPVAIASDSALDEELRHFAHALRTGAAFETGLEQGVCVVQALEAGQYSLDQTGLWVELLSSKAQGYQ